jgi:hypothetical protein
MGWKNQIGPLAIAGSMLPAGPFEATARGVFRQQGRDPREAQSMASICKPTTEPVFSTTAGRRTELESGSAAARAYSKEALWYFQVQSQNGTVDGRASAPW